MAHKTEGFLPSDAQRQSITRQPNASQRCRLAVAIALTDPRGPSQGLVVDAVSTSNYEHRILRLAIHIPDTHREILPAASRERSL